MAKNHSTYALGTKEYTLGDVILTTLLVRLQTDPVFFKREVLGRKKLSLYWELVQQRQSFLDADLNPMKVPCKYLTTLCLFLILTLLNGIFLGILYLLPKHSYMTEDNVLKMEELFYMHLSYLEIYVFIFSATLITIICCCLKKNRDKL